MHCVDLGESFPTHIFLQNLALIQLRTSPVKFACSPRTDPPGFSATDGSVYTKIRKHPMLRLAGIRGRRVADRASPPNSGTKGSRNGHTGLPSVALSRLSTRIRMAPNSAEESSLLLAGRRSHAFANMVRPPRLSTLQLQMHW